jgi:hypothetical protein
MSLLRLVLAGLSAGVVFLISTTAQAQTGSVEVVVWEKLNGKREAVIGVSVELADPKNSFPKQSKLTDDVDGKVVFTNIPAGSGYLVTVISTDYQAAPPTAVSVSGGAPRRIEIQLLAKLTEEITVSGEGAVVQLDETESSKELSAEFIGDLPVYGRDYQNVLTLASGVNDTDGDGNPTIHGSRERDLKVTVDGVSNVDPVTGQRMSQINADAIEEIQVIDAGADASQGGAVGGFAKLILKSGGNEFEGTVSLFAVDTAIDNDLEGDRDPLPFRRRQPSVVVSGPIVKDHLWYLVSEDYLEQETPVNVIGGEDAVEELTAENRAAKLTWQVNPRNRVSLQYTADPGERSPLGVSTTTPADSAVAYERGGPTYTMKWIATLSPSSLWESTVAFSDVGDDVTPFNPKARNSCPQLTPEGNDLGGFYCVDLSRASVSGAFPYSVSDVRQRRSYALDATKFVNEWLGGSHDVKYGMLLERTNYERQQISDPFLRLQRIPQQLQVFGGLDPNDSSLLQGQPAGTVSVFRYFSQGLNPTLTDRLAANARANAIAFYLSDTYQPATNFQITAGVRLGREEVSADGSLPIDPVKERRNFERRVGECLDAGGNDSFCLLSNMDAFTASPLDQPSLYPACSISLNPTLCELLQAAEGSGTPIRYRRSDRNESNNVNLAPRLSMSWDPFQDGRTRLSATFGRYFGDTFFEPYLAEQGPNVHGTIYEIDSDGNFLNTGPIGSVPFAISQVSRDLRSQYNDEYTLTYEREVASETSFKARYVNRHYRNQYQDIDLNHVPVLFDSLTPEQIGQFEFGCNRVGEFADCTGRQITRVTARQRPGGVVFATVQLDVPDGQADLQVVNPLFTNIYNVGNYNSSKYEAYILELKRRFYQNWEGSLSYTWSQAVGQAEDYGDALGDDVTNSDDEFGALATDQRHVFKADGRILVQKWGGFRLGGNVLYATGLPYSIVEVRPVLDFPTQLSGRSDAGGSRQYQTTRSTYPTGQRNDQRNSAYWNLNVNFQKEFKLKDSKATIQVDCFNLLGQTETVIGQIRRTYSSTTRGQLVPNDTPISGRTTGRFFQLAFKLNF